MAGAATALAQNQNQGATPERPELDEGNHNDRSGGCAAGNLGTNPERNCSFIPYMNIINAKEWQMPAAITENEKIISYAWAAHDLQADEESQTSS